MVFCAPFQMLPGLAFANVEVLNLANNHIANYGKSGLDETVDFLQKNNFVVTGINNLAIKKLNNTSFGFLGFDKSQQENPQFTEKEQDLILKSNKKVDVLIIAMHWGIEYQSHPTKGQRKLAEKLVELGADVVVGHHPHWVQDIESINGKPVYYSLGNFVFDQMWSQATREGLVIRLTFEGKKVIQEERLPVYMNQWAQPEFR